ncbi:AzlD domain-containing protein [Paratractidigestivibacter sp.]|uniref:AzlD domain-containing protein n=1 Tax=Paratractidigestivibacter sp. TaxID=2847316 RepID=UPI002AC9DE5B|nr:AzlD domain-containing protein [Paratractidigestivibacter sp.]
MRTMTLADFLAIWLPIFAVILACRTLPTFLLRGRELPPRVVEALGYIPPAAFAALVANDLFPPTLPALLATGVVIAVAWRTRSMLGCCVVGVVAYLLLSLL